VYMGVSEGGKKPPGKPRIRREHNNKVFLKELGGEVRIGDMYIRVYDSAGHFLTSRGTVSFSRRWTGSVCCWAIQSDVQKKNYYKREQAVCGSRFSILTY
jgi:hypothetical protein